MLALVAALAALQAALLLAWYWPGALPDTNTSGVWIALADDVAHGDFYRPLVSELGTGGTRYMPLFFVLHGALIKLGCAPLAAGVVLTLASALAAIIAVRALLRRLGATCGVACGAAVAMLGTVTFQMLLLTVRGDFLAAALNLAGVAAALDWKRSGTCGRMWLAAIFFAAAFLTKVTTVFGLAAVALWLASRREWRRAGALAGASALLMIAGVAAALWASDGRMWESFSAVASGDTNFPFVLSGPRRFWDECAGDPLLCVLLGAAVVAGSALRRSEEKKLIAWLGAATLLVTMVIFASPGTGKNHLLDLQALAVVVLALALAENESPARRAWSLLAFGALGIGMCVTWLPGVPSVRAFFERYHRPEIAGVDEFAARAGAGAQRMLAENPLVPILAGERPFVADLFNLELRMRRDAKLRRDMLERLRRGEFGAVVLSNWPDIFPRDVASPDDPLIAERWPALRRRGRVTADFYAALETRYRIVLVRRPYIYLLRDDRAFAPAR
ncbi:MAG TPA: glycosyltransferase 87 family protein [Opitutaceae bacterium]|nr:glycosyltransferase 87 family protein [Opitutaceae bacterium]